MSSLNPWRYQSTLEAARRRARESTYTKPLGLDVAGTDDQELKDLQSFLKEFYGSNFYSRESKAKRLQIREEYPEVALFYDSLVAQGGLLEEEEFWQRYQYRCDPVRILQYWDRHPTIGRKVMGKYMSSWFIRAWGADRLEGGEEAELPGEEAAEDEINRESGFNSDFAKEIDAELEDQVAGLSDLIESEMAEIRRLSDSTEESALTLMEQEPQGDNDASSDDDEDSIESDSSSLGLAPEEDLIEKEMMEIRRLSLTPSQTIHPDASTEAGAPTNKQETASETRSKYPPNFEQGSTAGNNKQENTYEAKKPKPVVEAKPMQSHAAEKASTPPVESPHTRQEETKKAKSNSPSIVKQVEHKSKSKSPKAKQSSTAANKKGQESTGTDSKSILKAKQAETQSTDDTKDHETTTTDDMSLSSDDDVATDKQDTTIESKSKSLQHVKQSSAAANTKQEDTNEAESKPIVEAEQVVNQSMDDKPDIKDHGTTTTAGMLSGDDGIDYEHPQVETEDCANGDSAIVEKREPPATKDKSSKNEQGEYGNNSQEEKSGDSKPASSPRDERRQEGENTKEKMATSPRGDSTRSAHAEQAPLAFKSNLLQQHKHRAYLLCLATLVAVGILFVALRSRQAAPQAPAFPMPAFSRKHGNPIFTPSHDTQQPQIQLGTSSDNKKKKKKKKNKREKEINMEVSEGKMLADENHNAGLVQSLVSSWTQQPSGESMPSFTTSNYFHHASSSSLPPPHENIAAMASIITDYPPPQKKRRNGPIGFFRRKFGRKQQQDSQSVGVWDMPSPAQRYDNQAWDTASQITHVYHVVHHHHVIHETRAAS